MTDKPSKPTPKPQRPEPDECCGSGCVPCIYDYYYEALYKWEQQNSKDIDSTPVKPQQ